MPVIMVLDPTEATDNCPHARHSWRLIDEGQWECDYCGAAGVDEDYVVALQEAAAAVCRADSAGLIGSADTQTGALLMRLHVAIGEAQPEDAEIADQIERERRINELEMWGPSGRPQGTWL